MRQANSGGFGSNDRASSNPPLPHANAAGSSQTSLPKIDGQAEGERWGAGWVRIPLEKFTDFRKNSSNAVKGNAHSANVGARWKLAAGAVGTAVLAFTDRKSVV